MKIQFTKDFAGCNFGEIHGTKYQNGKIVEAKVNNKNFDSSEHIDIVMAGIAINAGYAHEINEKEKENAVIEYETKVEVPVKRVIRAKKKTTARKKKK